MKRVLSFLSVALLLLLSSNVIAQGATCSTANQICGTTPPFAANTTGGTAVGSVGSVGCLSTTPNESWFFFEVATAGPVSGSITNSNNVDVDGAIFGPFSSTTTACAGLTAGNIVACDYTASATVPFSFNAVPGIYMVLITNFSGSATTIDLSFTAASNALIDCIAESADYSICEGDPAQAMSATVLSSTGLCPPATTTVTCTTNTPATTGSYTTNVSTSVNASCNISGVPAGATVTNVSYSINGGAVNGSWCQELRVNVDGPGTTYDITGGALVGATGTCTLAGLSAIGGWSGTSTNSPNGTYTFSFYETFNDAGTSQDFSVTQIQVVITYAIPGSEPQLTWFNTQTGGTAIGTGSPFEPIGAAGSDVPNTSTAGVYDFWVGCGNDGIRSQVQVFIHDVPVITSTSVVCAGSTYTATINVPAISTSPPGCTWQYSFNNGATWGSSNTLTGIAPGSANLTVLVRNSCRTQCVSAPATIVIPPVIIPTFNPVGPYCAGASIPALPTSSTNSPAITGTWSPAINNTTTTTYTFTPAAGQCATTTTLTITINPLPTVTVNSSTVCAGTATTVTATPGSAGTYSYSWTVPGGVTNPGNVASFSTTVAGTYSVVITNTTTGCASLSASGTVTVNPLPAVNAGPDQAICIGSSVTLAATGASTYSWNNGVTQGVAFSPAATNTYTVTGTSAAGCINTDQVVVTVNPLPIVNAPDATVCVGGSVTLTASGATTYTWAPASYLNTTTGASVVSTPPSNITYTVTGTDANGCIASDAVTVTVSGNAPINAGPDVAICIGQSTTLTATGGVTYNWDNGLGAGASHTVSPTATTTYVVSGTDANGCLGTDAVVVTLNPLPIVNAGADQTVCQGASVTLTATGASTYSWDNSVTNGVAFTPSVGTTTYTVTGTSAAGCVATDQVVVTVNPLPLVDAGPDQTVCIGTSVTLTATGAATYSWNNGVAQGIAFTPAATTTYTVTGTSAQGCIATDQVTVTVNPLPIVNAGPDQTVCVGTSVTLTASGAVTYSWNNGVTQGVSFTPASTNTYTVTGTDANGCINTDQVVVTVNPLPTINAGADQAICIGASVTLTATGGSTYSWNNGVTQGVAFSPSATQTYTVTGTDANGCINTDQVVVTVNPLPAVSAGPDFAVCTGGSATLNGSGAVAYTWNNGVTNGVAFTPATTNTYTVTGTDANGCINTDQVTVSVLTNAPVNAGPDVAICIGQSTTLTATGAVTYNWDQGLGTGNNFVVSPTGTTTYTVVGTDGNGCTGTDAITVTVNPLPTTNAGPDQTVCQGTSVTLTATGAATYSWDNGVTNGVAFTPGVGTVTYTVTGTSSAGCITTDQVIVTVNPLPTTDAGPDQTVCAGTAVTLTATGAASYSWTGGVSQGVAFTPAATATYTVTGTSAAGCTTTDQVTVTVNPLPTTNAGPDQTVCDGTAVTLTATGAATYSWDNGVTNGIAFTPAVGTITYTVTGTSAEGCITTDQVLVTVNPNPSPVIQGPTEYCAGFSATLSTTVPYTTYNWSTGATSPTINATVANNPISVTVTNGFGCQATSSTFTVTENAVITANFTETICQGGSVLIHGVLQSVAGTYSQTFTTASGCDSTSNVTLVVNALPAVNAGVDQAVCTGTSTVLSATGAINYTWNNGVTQGVPFTQAIGTTVYTVTGTDINGCVNTDQVTITVNPLPIVDAGVDQAVCIGGSVTLNGSGASTYTWNNGVTNGVAFSPSVTTTYTVTGTDANGCTNTDQMTVTVNPLPNVNAGPDVTTCAGGTVTLSGSGAVNYVWDNGITNGVAFTPASTGTYTVTGTDANGCVNTDQVLVTVSGLPAVNAGPDQTVCVGTSVTLSGSGAATYTWDNGVTNSVPFTPGVGTVTYTVTGTDGGGCINTDQVTVTVNPLPVVNAGPDQAVCIGTSVTLTGSGASTYTWNNGVSNGVAFTPSVTNTYTVSGTDANGCVNTDQVVVTVNPLPNVNAGPDQAVCNGGSVTLSGSGAVNYSWNNGVSNGVAFIPSSTTTYTVTGTDANGCINTDQVIVTVNPLPVVNGGPDQTVCIGTSVTLTATGAATYSWNNGVTNGVAFTPAATNTYTVTGTSAAGCISTDQVTVTVNPLPNVNAGPDHAICIGASTTLAGSGASTYTWNNGVTNGTSFSPTLTNTYTVVGTDINGCVNTDQVIVTVNALPNVNAGNDITVCEGASITLSGLGAQTYTWNNGVTNGVSFVQPVGTQTYTVVGTDANGCVNSDQVVVTVNALPNVNAGPDQTLCLGGSVTLTGSGASIYSWNNGVTNGVPFTPSAGSMTYTVTGTDANGCINTDQVVVTVNPLPNVNAGTDQVICQGESVTLTATGAITYSWNNGLVNGLAFTPPVGSTTYTVSGTDNNGCVNTDQVIVIVNPLPTVNAGNDISVCDGQSVVLTASGAVSYTWNNGVVNGSPFVPTIGTTTYTVVGTSNAGCINSDEVNVTVNPNPMVSFVPGAANGCTPFTTTLTNTTEDVSNCVWTISNGTVITGCGTVPVTFNQGGCYDVSLTTTSANGCSSTFTANNLICVEDAPNASFNPSSNQLSVLNTEVFFQNTTTGANQYTWTFGVTDEVSTDTNPTYNYPNDVEGSYVVTLIATSPLGCTDTATTVIQVYEELLFYVPNTFTPDNDNYNPVFLPIFTSGFDPYDYNLMIFNRWGEVIFESNNHEVGWDGSYGNNGEIDMVQDGVYTWKIEFKVTRWDERRRVVGHVNLIR